MVLVIHGEAGGLDELVIAVVGLAVLWIAVKIAGRKSADDDGGEAEGGPATDPRLGAADASDARGQRSGKRG